MSEKEIQKEVQRQLKIALKLISENFERTTKDNAVTGELIEDAIIRGLRITIRAAVNCLEDADKKSN